MKANTPADVWIRVAKGEPDACWPWLGGFAGRYGQLSVGGRRQQAHRVAFHDATGIDPGDKCVCHRCDNPPCCNPAHLFLGTVRENTRDAMRKGRLAVGERSARSTLTTAAVLAIRLRHAAGTRMCDLAREFGTTPTNIRFIVQRRTWRHV